MEIIAWNYWIGLTQSRKSVMMLIFCIYSKFFCNDIFLLVNFVMLMFNIMQSFVVLLSKWWWWVCKSAIVFYSSSHSGNTSEWFLISGDRLYKNSVTHFTFVRVFCITLPMAFYILHIALHVTHCITHVTWLFTHYIEHYALRDCTQ